MPATLPTRAAAGSPPAPIVHLHQPRDPAPPWQGSAIAAALGLQFLLMALIAWKVLAPAGGAETGNDSKIVAALEKLNSSVNVVEARRKAELADVRTQARAEFLDEAFRELKGADNGAISRLANKFDQSARLTEDVAAREALVREMRALVEDTRGKLQSLEVSAKREEKRLASQIDELTTRNGNLKAELNQKSELLASLQAKLNPKTDRAAEDAWRGTWWWVGGGAAAIIALVLGAWWSGTRDRPPIDGNSQAAANSDDTTNVTAEAKQTIGG